MIKLENTSVMNFENAIRGMRNPMNSWDKSDSFYCNPDECAEDKCFYHNNNYAEYVSDRCDNYTGNNYIIGKNDLELMKKLVKAGSAHRKFMRQIFVSVDITAPIYWWKEFDTYKVGTVANSTSTMHKIHSKPFDMSDFSTDHCVPTALKMMQKNIDFLEALRLEYIQTKDKKIWYSLIQLLPESYNQTRTVTMNYENLLNIYHDRKDHKLDEWRMWIKGSFCSWVSHLPYAKELIIGE